MNHDLCPDPNGAVDPRPSRGAPWLVALGAVLAAYGLGLQGSPAGAVSFVPSAAAAPVQGGGPTPGPQPTSAPSPVFATADSNNRMIAVTGVDITGQSVLYLVDTLDKQLAVYQASGGSAGTSGVRLVGARRIDLDLALHGYNDKSEYKYKDLEKEFGKLQAR